MATQRTNFIALEAHVQFPGWDQIDQLYTVSASYPRLSKEGLLSEGRCLYGRNVNEVTAVLLLST